MKRLVFTLLFSAVLACGAPIYAVDEADDIDMDRLHDKLVKMKSHLDRFVKDIVSSYPEGAWGGPSADIKVDVVETEKTMVVRADLPGMRKDKIEVTLDNGKVLKISGVREVVKQEASPGMITQERSYGSFERTLELPKEGRNDGIQAAYKDGVLEIVIPKKSPDAASQVKIVVQ